MCYTKILTESCKYSRTCYVHINTYCGYNGHIHSTITTDFSIIPNTNSQSQLIAYQANRKRKKKWKVKSALITPLSNCVT